MSRSKKQARFPQVADAKDIIEDFKMLDARTRLRCSYEVEQLLLIQSVEGHAHSGHGLFYGETYPNTTQSDIASALKLNPLQIRTSRQDLIDEIKYFVIRTAEGDKTPYLINIEGEPFLRSSILRCLEIDIEGVLIGLYLGGLRDDTYIRKKTSKKYGINIGYGENFLIDREILSNVGLNGYKLSQEAHEQEIDNLKTKGLLAEKENPNTEYMYVRFSVGTGASDDAAIVMAGKLFGFSACVGCFLADAVDTLEKFSVRYSDQDSEIADLIKRHHPNLPITEEDAIDLTYLCSIPPERKGRVPDSSLRHLLEIDEKIDQCAIESHFAFVQNKPYSFMDLDHGESTNDDFYDYILERLNDFKRKGK
ncbi:MAG: hypothetical protein SNJ70_07965 [Armatimonadota bacterium]